MDIYVGNLNYSVKDSDLNKIFSEYGEVTSIKLIVDHETKNSKGFAFISMKNSNEGSIAIEELNDAEYDGRKMVVREAKPKN